MCGSLRVSLVAIHRRCPALILFEPAGERLGTSSGFGLHLVNIALDRGDYVIASARDISTIATLFPPSDRLKIMQLDVTQSAESIGDLAKEAVSFWGRVDVLVRLILSLCR